MLRPNIHPQNLGTQCASSPSKLPHRYCVMDWFKVTAGWAERDPRSRYTRWKFRFEKLDTATDGWWAASPTLEYDTPTEMVKASCNSCKTESPHIYEEGWICLKPECVKFWTVSVLTLGGNIPFSNKQKSSMAATRLQISSIPIISYAAVPRGLPNFLPHPTLLVLLSISTETSFLTAATFPGCSGKECAVLNAVVSIAGSFGLAGDAYLATSSLTLPVLFSMLPV